MGRKDAARFIALEKRIEMLKTNQDKIMMRQNKIIGKRADELIRMRDLINKLIEGK